MIRILHGWAISGSVLLLLFTFAGIQTAGAQTKDFNVPAQSATTGIPEFARQAGIQILVAEKLVHGKRTAAVTGSFTIDKALRQLLEGTGLSATSKDGATFTVAATQSTSTSLNTAVPERGSSTVGVSQAVPGEPVKSSELEKDGLTEIVVTGTMIRGIAPIGSPLLVYTQEDFDKAGAATVEQFLLTIPQNFATRTQFTSAGGSLPGVTNQDVFASEVDLRGLGTGTTLVLVNGQRLAPTASAAGQDQHSTDISMIPLSAIDHIEVLLDGASAIYGSDAVGGVVNIIMKTDYRGANSRVRVGTTTRGGGEETQAAQSFGTGWSTGNAILSYEYLKQQPLTLNNRPFTTNPLNPTPLNLTPGDVANSAFFSAQQRIADRVGLNGNFSFTERKGEFPNRPGSPVNNVDTFNSREINAGVGISVRLTSSWKTDVYVGDSRNKNSYSYSSLDFFTQLLNTSASAESETRTINATASGDVFRLPTGMIKAAVGANFRKDSLEGALRYPQIDPNYQLPRSLSRNVHSGFTEFAIPLMAPGATPLPRLALSLAARYDDYSSFGGKLSPKVGLRWVVDPSLQIRASFSTSFRAPDLTQTDPSQQYYLLAPVDATFASALPAGSQFIIQRVGTNPTLTSETSRNLTLGADFTPESLHGFKASLTAFDIRYKDRILEGGGFNTLLTLTDPAWAPIRAVRGTEPDAEFNTMLASILSGYATAVPNRIGGCAFYGGVESTTSPICIFPVGSIGAVIDYSLRNLSETDDRGVDVTMNQKIDSSIGTVDLGVNAAWVLKKTQRVTDTAPAIELVNTIFNTPRLKFRANAGWNYRGLSTTAILNYVDSYKNNAVAPSTRVSSWSTVDLSLRYDLQVAHDSWLRGTSVAFNANNLFDSAPPYALSGVTALTGWTYDAANANPYGRVVSLMVNKNW